MSIEEIVAARDAARTRGSYPEADALRLQLLNRGVVVLDAAEPGSGVPTTWTQLPATASRSCMSWSHKRQAYCPAARCGADWFCARHCEAGLAGRIPCPLDPRHNLKPAAMAGHLERCQQAPGRPALAISPAGAETAISHGWIEAGCNGGAEGAAAAATPAEAAAALAASRDAAVLEALEAKVDAALGALNALSPLPLEVEDEDQLQATADGGRKLSDAQCEQRQLSALAAQMARLAAAADDDYDEAQAEPAPLLCMECCAGRGKLSLALQAALSNSSGSAKSRPLHHVLIDRCVAKRPSDKRLHAAAARSGGGSAQRLTVDLADVRLERLPALAQLENRGLDEEGEGGTEGKGEGGRLPVLLHGKHLCGEAADLSLRAASRLRCAPDADGGEGGAGDVRDVRACFALCCHHLCSWEALYGREHLEAHGIGKFELAVRTMLLVLRLLRMLLVRMLL